MPNNHTGRQAAPDSTRDHIGAGNGKKGGRAALNDVISAMKEGFSSSFATFAIVL